MAQVAAKRVAKPISRNARMVLVVAGVIVILVAVGLYLSGPVRAGWAAALGFVGAVAAGYGLLAGRSLAQIRSSRSLYYGTSATLLTLAVVASVVLVNVIAEREFHVRWDLTANKMYTLSDQTRTLLRQLDMPVTVYAFVREGDSRGQQIVDLIREYAYRSDHLRLQVIDPDSQPGLARAYEITQYNSVVVEAGDRRRTIQPFDMFGFNFYGQVTEFRGEQALTRALLGVTQGSQGKVYFTTGHGERTLENELYQFRTFLTGEGYEVETVNLAQNGQVPEDAAVLVVAGPTRDFDPQEIEAVHAFIDEGGRLLLLLDPASANLERIANALTPWGIAFRMDVVVDPVQHYFIDPLSPIPSYERHAVTEDLIDEGLGIVLPRSRSLVVQEPERAGVRVQPIFYTSDQAWGETQLQGRQLAKDPEDAAGPLTLGAAVEAGAARLVAVGSSSFATNDAITFQGNVDFLMNSVNWLAGREENLAIRPKTPEYRLVTLTGTQASVIFYSTVVFVPLLFLVAAGAVAWRRRHL